MSLPFDIEEAEHTLAAADETLARVMDTYGPCTWTLRTAESSFGALLRSIVFQQLSTASANAIYKRLVQRFPDARPDPATVLGMPDDMLRETGISRPKIRYIKDLAERTEAGLLPTLDAMASMDDEVILERLTAVKGIGRWTVEMLLMFNLGRPDVLPSTDLVIRRGVQHIYGWDEMPTFKELDALGERWRPYRSVACWYIWRYEDGDNDAW